MNEDQTSGEMIKWMSEEKRGLQKLDAVQGTGASAVGTKAAGQAAAKDLVVAVSGIWGL